MSFIFFSRYLMYECVFAVYFSQGMGCIFTLFFKSAENKPTTWFIIWFNHFY